MANPNYTIKTIGVDAGMLYVGTTPIGPSIGGYTHDPGVQIRVVEADGFTTEMEGMGRITGFDTHLRGRVKELTGEMIMRLYPGSSSDGSASNNAITPAPARQFLTSSELISDVRLVYRKHDIPNQAGSYGAIIYPLMRPENSPQSGEDSNEHIRELDWKAVLLSTQNANDPPFIEVTDYDHDTFDLSDYV